MAESNRVFSEEETIKALECCSTGKCPGDVCPYHKETEACNTLLSQNALGVINRINDALGLAIKLNSELEADRRLANVELSRLNAKIETLQIVNAEMHESLRLASEANKDMRAELESSKEQVNLWQEEASSVGCANEWLKASMKNAKTEAIKEFWSRLQGIAYRSEVVWSHGEHPMLIELDDAEEIYEEMVGEG